MAELKSEMGKQQRGVTFSRTNEDYQKNFGDREKLLDEMQVCRTYSQSKMTRKKLKIALREVERI